MERDPNYKGWAQIVCPHPRERGPPGAQGFTEFANRIRALEPRGYLSTKRGGSVQSLTLRADKRQLVFVLFALAISAVALGVVCTSKPAEASSHREAPYISGDPQADATDVYAFRSPDKPNTVTLVANYVPLEVAAAGPNFYRFGGDVLYEINGDTFLHNAGQITSLDDSDLNQEQFYSLSVLRGDDHNDPSRKGKVITNNL